MKSVIRLYAFLAFSLYFSRKNASVVPDQLITSLWTGYGKKIFQFFMDLFVVIRVLRHTFIQNTMSVCCWFNFHWKGSASESLRIAGSLHFHEAYVDTAVSLAFGLLTILSASSVFLGWNWVGRSVSLLFCKFLEPYGLARWFACGIPKKYSTLWAIILHFPPETLPLNWWKTRWLARHGAQVVPVFPIYLRFSFFICAVFLFAWFLFCLRGFFFISVVSFLFACFFVRPLWPSHHLNQATRKMKIYIFSRCSISARLWVRLHI